MSQMDVRSLLQYVPQFRGKVFVIVVDVSSSALAETMLDLLSLQNIGVKLVIVSSLHRLDNLLDRAAEAELKYSQLDLSLEDTQTEALTREVLSGLDRGQAMLLGGFLGEVLSEPLLCLARSLSAFKLVWLYAEHYRWGGRAGALKASDIVEREEKDSVLYKAAKACILGIPRVHLLNGNYPAVLLGELFSNEGVGVMVYGDSYREIRPVGEEDIVELLGMIGRSVRKSRLVPRTYHEIKKNLEDYYVMVIDENVVGCVALLKYPETPFAEVACLYVKQAHEMMGYGAELVHHVEKEAKRLGIPRVFALTNRAASFFKDRMGYRELDVCKIPESRYKQLLESGRDSRAFEKFLMR